MQEKCMIMLQYRVKAMKAHAYNASQHNYIQTVGSVSSRSGV